MQPDRTWAALLSARIVTRGRPVGAGWKTAAELAPLFGVSPQSARPKLAALVAAGEIERQSGRTDCGLPCAYFRPITRA